MSVDKAKIEALYEKLHDPDFKVQAQALKEASTLKGPELTAILKPYGAKFKKYSNHSGEEWYVTESSWSFSWSAGGAELFFNRPGKSWEKKRDNVLRLDWYGGNLMSGFSGVNQLKNLEEVLVRSGKFSNLAPISACKKLKTIKFTYDVEVDSIAELQGMEHLEELEFYNQVPSDLLEVLESLTGLRILKCKVPAGADLSFLPKLSKLESLILTAEKEELPQGYEDAIAQMKHLQKLDIQWDRENFYWDKSKS